MNGLKRMMAVLLVGGAGFGLFVACGGETTDCTFDADCADGEACEAQLCVPTCVTEADCAAGEECGVGVNTTLTVCKAGSTNGMTNGGTNGMTNGMTNGVTESYYVVRVQSTTSATESCADVTDPGPDIFAVGLEDGAGTKLSFGSIDWEEISLTGNDQSDTSVIDGNAPDLGADNCPDMFAGNVVSLGCEATSWIAVSFADGDGNPIPLESGADQYIRVYEWGGQCTTGSVDDTYNVDICTDTAGIRGGDDTSCTISVLVDAAGEASNEIGF